MRHLFAYKQGRTGVHKPCTIPVQPGKSCFECHNNPHLVSTGRFGKKCKRTLVQYLNLRQSCDAHGRIVAVATQKRRWYKRSNNGRRPWLGRGPLRKHSHAPPETIATPCPTPRWPTLEQNAHALSGATIPPTPPHQTSKGPYTPVPTCTRPPWDPTHTTSRRACRARGPNEV